MASGFGEEKKIVMLKLKAISWGFKHGCHYLLESQWVVVKNAFPTNDEIYSEKN